MVRLAGRARAHHGDRRDDVRAAPAHGRFQLHPGQLADSQRLDRPQCGRDQPDPRLERRSQLWRLRRLGDRQCGRSAVDQRRGRQPHVHLADERRRLLLPAPGFFARHHAVLLASLREELRRRIPARPRLHERGLSPLCGARVPVRADRARRAQVPVQFRQQQRSGHAHPESYAGSARTGPDDRGNEPRRHRRHEHRRRVPAARLGDGVGPAARGRHPRRQDLGGRHGGFLLGDQRLGRFGRVDHAVGPGDRAEQRLPVVHHLAGSALPHRRRAGRRLIAGPGAVVHVQQRDGEPHDPGVVRHQHLEHHGVRRTERLDRPPGHDDLQRRRQRRLHDRA